MATKRPSSAIEDYLRAIYGLVERGVEVSNATLAKRLRVSPSSVSGMVAKLADLGLVTHVPYHGVELTEPGRRAACDVLRRHRLIELYLVEELGYTWDEVHVEADVLEHAVSDSLIERISAKLGDPTRDPHGDPIPAADGSVEQPPTHLLRDLEPGASGEVARVWDTNPEILRYLAHNGITLGARIEVLERQPFGGPLVVRVGERTHSLGNEVTAVLLIRVPTSQ
ncbi:metal-dependent transcriptional regulator [Allokutzneria sp. A3M-2-11 16]|uniref:metal-dependent transcriptional regulator n=1 Tax=Allokutzneria sp. A3M-2-11 16 TaxID=2962043 RepID=UPI0020B87DB2|nr:metal-dependent transcriptional regulator [Allokutzneria sp. A3M-2-11 16]MCP3802118.1 metal-dependent transcriptional regulator [Allokutzneria sp. A3M-2-11 16]